jgi:hypothetical protein
VFEGAQVDALKGGVPGIPAVTLQNLGKLFIRLVPGASVKTADMAFKLPRLNHTEGGMGGGGTGGVKNTVT